MIYQEGNFYHLLNRGCNKDLIFRERADYNKLMHIIRESKIDEYLQLCAFSFMPNHYHFLVKQITEKPVSSWIRYVFSIYVKYFNRKYDRKGTLFEDKVKVKVIDKMTYLKQVTHYINNNPQDLLDHEYSTLSHLKKNTIIYLPFYTKFFNSVYNYKILFEEYKQLKSRNELVEDYLFGNHEK